MLVIPVDGIAVWISRNGSYLFLAKGEDGQ
jgi:hypothetical protein